MIDPIVLNSQPPTVQRSQESPLSYSTTIAWYLGRAVARAVNIGSRITQLFHEKIGQLTDFITETGRALSNCFHLIGVEVRDIATRIIQGHQPPKIAPKGKVIAPLFKNYSTNSHKLPPSRRLRNQEIPLFLNKSLQLETEVLSELEKRQTRASSSVTSSHFGSGITNGGNSCYIASVLQSLRFASEFRVKLNSNKLKENDLAQKLKKMYETIEGGRAVDASEINEFRRTAIDYGWKPAYEFSQEDPTAFCQFLLDQLGFPSFKFKTEVLHNFQLPVASLEVQGGDENHIELPLGEIPDDSELSQVAIKNVILEELDKNSIVQRLAGHTLHPEAYEIIAKMKDIDLIPTLQSVQMTNDNIPLVLPLSLRRYGFNKETKKAFKIQKKIHPSQTIDFPIADKPGYCAKFRLISFVNHDGAHTSGGHYRAYVQVESPVTELADSKKQIFFEFDDKKTNAYLDTAQIELDVAKNGYLFVYQFSEVVESVPKED